MIKKSVCIRFGNRHDACCAPVTTCSGGALPWVDTCRYLGIYFVSARSFKCTFEPAAAKFYKSFNAIFGKVGRVASESVIMQLISSKCLPVLLYATETCPFLARDQSSVSFAVTRVLMNIFRTRSRDVTDQCQIMLGMLPVEHHVFLRKVRFLLRFKNSDNLICSLFLDNASMQ